MNSQRIQHITVQLDSHSVSLDVPADQEHLYRKAAEQLNQKYLHYLKIFQSSVSAEKLWVFVALDMAYNLAAEAYAHRLQPIDEKIQELNKLIIQNIK